MVPNGVATSAIASAPHPLKLNAFTPSARLLSPSPIPSGTITSFHFEIESAKSPSGIAIAPIASAPHPLKLNF